jgi:hypothetical protein
LTVAASPNAPTLRSRLAEPYAFAMLIWPAVIALATPLSDGWADWMRYTTMGWLVAMQLAAYTGRRGIGFGNAVLLMSGIVALACASFPSPWTLAWLPALLVTLHAAQCIGLGRSVVPHADPIRSPLEKSAIAPGS